MARQARLKDLYESDIKPALMKRFEFATPLQVPKLEKIVLNVGVGEAVADRKRLASAVEDLTLISGQKPLETVSRRSIAGFKLRDGMKIGAKVTLRKYRMYEFLDRLITVALPRTRDFRGLNPKSFDGRGNYALGVKEQIIFPEIEYDRVDTIRGLDIVFVTSASSNEQARALLTGFGMPFPKEAA